MKNKMAGRANRPERMTTLTTKDDILHLPTRAMQRGYKAKSKYPSSSIDVMLQY